jgi:aminopeptidase N
MVDTKVGLAGGAMEYPTFITVSPSRLPQDKIRADALTVFHEIAHQWWYGMVASNEFEEAWLDEGFAVYSERRALEERFGKEANIIDMWGLKVSDLDHARLGNLLDLQSDPVVRKSWEFRNYPSYLSRVYFKASLVLETLRNYLGQEKMDHVLKEYFRRYKFKHPNTGDFIQVVNEVTEEDFTFFFEQLLFGTGYCDYEVVSIESIPIETGDEKDRYATEVQLRRLGEVVIPIDVEIQLEDGQRIKEFWEGKERWYKIELKTDAKIRSATIDPLDKNVVDINFNNNSLSAEFNDPVLMKISTQCLFGLENLIHLLTCF